MRSLTGSLFLSRMASDRRPYGPVSLAGLVTLLATGCASPAVLRPLDESTRAGLGRVALTASANVSRIRFQVPDSRADVAARTFSDEVVTTRDVARMAGGSADPFTGAIVLATPVVIMGASPVWQGLHRTACLLVADSDAAVTAARQTMTAATAGVRFEAQLQAEVAAEFARVSPATNLTSSSAGADTLLELTAYEPALTGAEGTNPALALRLGLRIRLLDARSGAELYYDYLDYAGERHTLVQWAADDARLFQAELGRCLTPLSREIVAQLAVRPATEVASRRELAAVGLSRRPAQPLLGSSTGTLWSPTYRPPSTAPRYVRR